MPLRTRTLVFLAACAFIVANTFNALNKGGDARDFFDGGRRLLQGKPLYEGSSPASGFIGPPFQAMFFLPFGALADASDAAARLAWYALNLVCLAVGVAFWWRAWRRHASLHSAPWFALLAILLPLQTNFEHQNMNPLLLAAVGVAAYCLVVERWRAAGVLIGFAAAMKIFPALAILYLAIRRFWIAAAVAVATTAALTALPVAVYGWPGFRQQFADWLRLASGGWPTRGANQSLMAAIDRALPWGSASSVHTVSDVPVEFAIFALCASALVAVALVAAGRTRRGGHIACELAAVTLLSVLLSPVAWDHYWVLLFPAFLLVYDARDGRLLGPVASVLFWIAAVLTSGLSRLTLGADGWSLARQMSVSAVAALILYFGLVLLWRRLEDLRG